MVKYCFFLAFLAGEMCFSQLLPGQQLDDSCHISLQDVISRILDNIENDYDMEATVSELLELSEHPVQINSAGIEQWQKIFWLSAFQIQSIQSYIHTIGSVSSCYELLYIPGISRDDVLLLTPFIGFDRAETNKKFNIHDALTAGRYQFLLRCQYSMQQQVGFSNSGSRHFTGDPLKTLTRYTYQLADYIHLGYTAEKDAGEPFFCKSNHQGFDFNSFHMQVNTHGLLKKMILGDYQVSLGQGLISGSGFYLGKTGVIMGGMRHNSGINHYQVTDENKFNRGLAVVLGYKTSTFMFWGSHHAIDGNIVAIDSLTDRVTKVSSLQTSGIHATASEIADEDAVIQSMAGTRLSFDVRDISVGVSYLYRYLNADLYPAAKPYNLYYFRGNRNDNASFDFQIRLHNLILFGEEAMSKNGGKAFLNGFQSYVNSRMSCSIISRWYQPSYQSISGKAFGENASCANEYGLFMGCELIPFKYTRFSVYMDVFRFPWLRYGVDIPSSGHEFVCQMNIIPSPVCQMNLQFRNKMKQDIGGDSTISESKTLNNSSSRWRYNITLASGSHFKFNSRIEYSTVNQSAGKQSRGVYIGQDVLCKFKKFPLVISGRLAWFKTDSSAVRIYAYEPDMLYSNAIPVMCYHGYRAFVMLQYRLGEKLFFWLKYDQTFYVNRKTVGSDLYLINGNSKSELKIQLLKKF